ncbi:hypothetical protein [Acidovorax sp. Leaf78]|uniref:hypothetical protein n=1 Tax=unclassified Acidovorax TaxID=2684926 RepID=UPI0006F73C47|nr:hypothetical protein [Acidovorax sp. Leaf78]KQO14295.1 hypothetical protein ASF16_18745 [Acidovorax sp. Leaf78]
MVLVKTQAGQEALKDRRGSLSSRQRSAFILFDGKRTTGEILAATAAMGITQDDVQAMLAQGLLEPLSGKSASGPVAVAGTPDVAAASLADAMDLGTVATAGEGSGRTPKERYQAAYPIATELTAGLGLRGFRLNLAVEGAGSFDDLAALAPKIREAVGDAKFERLDQALFD